MRSGRAMLAVAAIGVSAAVLVAGCVEVPSVFRCTGSSQCARNGAAGTCEETGWCSLTDGQCPSGRRYVSAAGDGLAGSCVSPGTGCGAPGKACCAQDTCASALYQCVAGTCSERPCVEGVSAGNAFNCAHRVDGTLWCWGDNAVGQLGNGTQGNRTATPTQVLAASGSGFLAGQEHVFAGAEFACSHDERDQLVSCFGRNDAGQLGNGTTDQRARPGQVLAAVGGTPFTGAMGHTAGGRHACVWDNIDAALWCWGDNQYGQLGRGNTVTADPKVHVPGSVLVKVNTVFKHVTVVAAGTAHTCAAQNDDSVWCWGRNDAGQLGSGSLQNDHEALPVRVVADGGGPLPKVIALGAGESHTCAVRGDGSVWCWGAGGDGQLGQQIPVGTSPAALPVVGLGAGSTSRVAGGARHTCALGKDRKVRCWGGNGQGQLGTGTMDSGSSTPVEVKGLVDVVDLTLGANHACAVKADGTVWCWGQNDARQLGTVDGKASATPVRVDVDCTP